MDIKRIILDKLTASRCVYTESEGIIKILTPNGELWDFTTPVRLHPPTTEVTASGTFKETEHDRSF